MVRVWVHGQNVEDAHARVGYVYVYGYADSRVSVYAYAYMGTYMHKAGRVDIMSSWPLRTRGRDAAYDAGVVSEGHGM